MGMDIEFLGNGRVSLFMKDYIEEFIASSSKYLDAKLSSSAKNVSQNIN